MTGVESREGEKAVKQVRREHIGDRNTYQLSLSLRKTQIKKQRDERQRGKKKKKG